MNVYYSQLGTVCKTTVVHPTYGKAILLNIDQEVYIISSRKSSIGGYIYLCRCNLSAFDFEIKDENIQRIE